jgi:hypothetical protein
MTVVLKVVLTVEKLVGLKVVSMVGWMVVL